MLFESHTPNASCASASAPVAVKLSFTGKDVFASSKSADAINLLTAGRPVQPAAKLLDNWFNGNSTNVNVGNGPRPKVTPASLVNKNIHMTVAM
jgi:accessory colonization factor AcfC